VTCEEVSVSNGVMIAVPPGVPARRTGGPGLAHRVDLQSGLATGGRVVLQSVGPASEGHREAVAPHQPAAHAWTTIQAPMPPGTEGFIDWKDGRLLGIEILDATRHIRNDLLQTADTE
jgi:hypothetical protein